VTFFSSTNIRTSLQLFDIELGKMGSKALLVLVMLLASVLLLSAEVASKDVDKKLDKNDGNSFHEFFTVIGFIRYKFNTKIL